MKKTARRIIKILIILAILVGIIIGIRACVAPPKEQAPAIA